MTIVLHQGDIPEDLAFPDGVAIDTETMGLDPHRDPLCLVQLSAGDGTAHMVQFAQEGGPPDYSAPRLRTLLTDRGLTKIFHFARFDIAMLSRYLECETAPIYCTKIASKLSRTYTDRHGLRDLCRELLQEDISKQQQSSDWGAAELTPEQQAYAASDVLYLHQLRAKLNAMLARNGRGLLAQACFDFVPARAALDLAGWDRADIFAH